MALTAIEIFLFQRDFNQHFVSNHHANDGGFLIGETGPSLTLRPSVLFVICPSTHINPPVCIVLRHGDKTAYHLLPATASALYFQDLTSFSTER